MDSTKGLALKIHPFRGTPARWRLNEPAQLAASLSIQDLVVQILAALFAEPLINPA
jgi:hypothetical protein